ncbi:MAG TPA: hypothetical protein VGB42_08380, partial [Candidatus Thermoplasmatota archaeon]
MAPPPSRWARLLVVATAGLALAGAADALSVTVSSPPDAAWFASRAVTLAGTASGPAADSLDLSSARGLANATGDGAAVRNGTEVHLTPTGLTNWRFLETFDYTLGTPATAISDSFHHAFIGGSAKNWTVTDALASRMPGSPALGARENLSSFTNELYWHATVPRPIAGANVSFRFGADPGARLQFHSSVTGLRNNYSAHMDSLFETLNPSSASLDLGSRFAGSQTVYLRFTFTRGSNGTEWAAIDDLEVDISFAPRSGPQNATFSQSFAFGGVNPALDGLWWTEGGGWSASNALLHTSSSETWEEARFAMASRVSGANLSFSLGCQNLGPTDRYIFAEAGPGAGGPWTRLAETNSTASTTPYSGDVSSLAGNTSLLFRVTAQNRCFLSNFALTLSVDGDPPDMPRGALVGEALDMGRPVDWLTATHNATVPPGTTANFWLRWSDNGASWSRWVRADGGPFGNFATSRFVQPMVTLAAAAWDALPVVSGMSLRFSGIREVSVTVDGGVTWEPMLLTFAPNASTVTWSGTVTLDPGANFVTVRALDTTGASAAWNTTVGWDTLAPDPPTVTGAPGPFVNSTQLTWSWEVPPDEGLGVEEYAVRVGSLAGGGDLVPLLEVGNTTEYTYVGAADGRSYYFSVRAKDRAGNWGPWGNATGGTTVDRTPPGTGTAPAPAAFVNQTRLTWTWEPFSDNESGVAAYEVRAGTAPGASDAASGIQVADPAFTLEGANHGKRYYLSLRARDQAGNWGAWGPPSEAVAVDLVAPTAPGAPSGPDGFRNVTAATWNWSEAQDHLAGVAAYEIHVGTSAGASDLFFGVSSQRSIHLTGLPDGAAVHVRVRAVDAAGNLGPWAQAPVPLVVDRTAPPGPGGLEGPTGWINRTSASWSWSAVLDPVSGLDFYEVRIGTFPGGGDLLLNHPVVGTSFTFAALREDTETYFSVRAADNAGNRGPWSVSSAVMVDMSAPSVPGAVNATASPSNSARVEWAWSPSTDSGSGVAFYLIRIGTAPAAGDVLEWTPVKGTSYAIDSARSGSAYQFSIRAVDAVGWGSRDRTPDAPVVVDLEPPAAPEVWAAALATREDAVDIFWGLVLDAGGSGVDRFEVAFGRVGGPEETLELSAFQFVFELAGLDGERLVARVRATDRAGNTGPWSSPLEVLFDRSPPTPPTDPTVAVEGRTVTVAWGASQDAGVGDIEYMVTVGTAPGAADVVSLALTNATSYAFAGEPGKTYYIAVRAVDGL